MRIMQPGQASPEEQQLIEKFQWEIESCTVQSTLLHVEMETTELLIETKKKKLEEVRS
jgi:hypothetical protein